MIELLADRFYYVTFAALFAVGLYMLVDSDNLVKKVIGLNVFQISAFLFFVTAAYVEGGAPAVVGEEAERYVNPLPHVLILTAIVVGVSLTALALALVLRIYEEYGTLDEDGLREVMSDE